MKEKNPYICPVELSGSLDNRVRRWLQNPSKILTPYINPGMKILDIGCGPGFFTLEMARLTGSGGAVVAADLQQGMLDKIAQKINGTELSERITLHLCQQDKMGLTGKFDFVFAFYVVHEIPDQLSFFREVFALLKPGGKLLITEPKFHVSKESFERTIGMLAKNGFAMLTRRSSLINREVLTTIL